MHPEFELIALSGLTIEILPMTEVITALQQWHYMVLSLMIVILDRVDTLLNCNSDTFSLL